VGREWGACKVCSSRMECPSPKGLSMCHIGTVTEGGRVFQLKSVGAERPERLVETAKRGKVREFSARSRLRMLVAFAEIDKAAGLPVFVTLTVGREWSRDPGVWSKWLHAFHMALERKFPGVWGAWRKDFQPNREDHAVHFHELLWGLPELETVVKGNGDRVGKYGSERNRALYQWFADTWSRIVADGDRDVRKAGTRVEVVRSWRGVMFYAARYMANPGQVMPVECPGRMWGRIGSNRWRVSKVEVDLTPREFIKARRVVRKYLRRKTGRVFKSRRGAGVTAFMPAEEGLRVILWAKGVRDGNSKGISSKAGGLDAPREGERAEVAPVAGSGCGELHGGRSVGGSDKAMGGSVRAGARVVCPDGFRDAGHGAVP
jgi:hypothetical protein